MDPVTLSAIAVATSVAGAGASIYSGIQQGKALNQQADAARIEAEIAGIRGKQVSASKRDELNRVLAAIDTMRTSRGVGLDSPTGFAIRRKQREDSQFARNAAELSERLRQMQARTKAAGFSSAASLAPVQGFIQAAPQLASAAKGIGDLPLPGGG